MSALSVLIACERSGIVRDAFRARGHYAYSCDIEPDENDPTNPLHIVGDARTILRQQWDLIIAHPPCTYLASSGLHWNSRIPGREEKTEEAFNFAWQIWQAPCPRMCLENPVGRLTWFMRNAGVEVQFVQPHEFGHDASKRTGLITRGLPKLKPTCQIAPRMVNGKPRWANQTDSGQNRLAPGPKRAADRARTYQGIADAMAEQWGAL